VIVVIFCTACVLHRFMVRDHIRELRRTYTGFLVEKPEGYTPVERARRRWYWYS